MIKSIEITHIYLIFTFFSVLIDAHSSQLNTEHTWSSFKSIEVTVPTL